MIEEKYAPIGYDGTSKRNDARLFRFGNSASQAHATAEYEAVRARLLANKEISKLGGTANLPQLPDGRVSAFAGLNEEPTGLSVFYEGLLSAYRSEALEHHEVQIVIKVINTALEDAKRDSAELTDESISLASLVESGILKGLESSPILTQDTEVDQLPFSFLIQYVLEISGVKELETAREIHQEYAELLSN